MPPPPRPPKRPSKSAVAAAIRTLEAAKQYLTDEELDALLGPVYETAQEPPPLPTRDPPYLRGLSAEQLERGRSRLRPAGFRVGEVAFSWSSWDWEIRPTQRESRDYGLFFQSARESAVRRLSLDFQKHGSLKLSFATTVVYRRSAEDTPEGGDEELERGHTAKTSEVLTADSIPGVVEQQLGRLATAIEETELRGSGWRFDRVEVLLIAANEWRPMRGARWVKCPPAVAKTKACLNVKNTLPRRAGEYDDECFRWSVLAGLHPADRNAERVSNYRQYAAELDFSGIDFPVRACKRTFQKFERQNAHVSLSVYGYDAGGFAPLYVDGLNYQRAGATHVRLLLLDNGGTEGHGHYVLIRSLSRLIGAQFAAGNGKQHICERCLYHTRDERVFKHHEVDCKGICGADGAQVVRMPDPAKEDTVIRFKAVEKQMPAPYCVYADFEAMNVPIDRRAGQGSHHTTEHAICSAAYLITGPGGEIYARALHRGTDSAVWLIKELQRHHSGIVRDIKAGQQPPRLSAGEEARFRAATHCHICEKEVGASRVRDHDHLTGAFRGAAHEMCNLQWRLDPKKYKLPVFFHNLKGYDGHFLVRAFAECEGRMSIIPQNFEKYLSFSLGGLVFKDSLQFMASSLDTLVKNLGGAVPITKQVIARLPPLVRPFVLEKGVFPYKFLDSVARFDEVRLPPRDAFKSDLTGEDISRDDYRRAVWVYDLARCKDFGDYHDLYLETDVALLADVFETFRTLMREKHGLDPAHYLTAPGMAWDAMLKLTGVELELMTEMDQQLFVEKGLRGGICQVSHRAARANNPMAEATGGSVYDPSKPRTFLTYQDMNNLYGGAMVDYLPTGGFAWVEPQGDPSVELALLADRPKEGPRGAFYEVDLEYPEHLHDAHNDYPLAPEVGVVTESDLSPWAAALAPRGYDSRKLLLTLRDKERYVLHYRNLQEYLRLGLKLRKVHRILEFDQSPWMRPWIEKNTDLRRAAHNEFEKDLYKLLNNACFGKTMESVRKRTDIQLLRDSADEPGERERFRKMVAKPTYASRKVFKGVDGEASIVAVQRHRTCVVLNKPVYIGLAVLDLSKLQMVSFLYDEMKPRYGDKVRVLYTDTDSFVLEVETDDLYADMARDGHLYDTSNYKAGPLKALADANPSKEKRLGLMKDEFGGRVIHSFVGLKPKMYSLKGDNEVVKKAKGNQRCVVKKQISHDDYWGVVAGGKPLRHINVGFRTNKHVVTTCRVEKKSLSAFDAKRWITEDGVSSYAYGHWRTRAAP